MGIPKHIHTGIKAEPGFVGTLDLDKAGAVMHGHGGAVRTLLKNALNMDALARLTLFGNSEPVNGRYGEREHICLWSLQHLDLVGLLGQQGHIAAMPLFVKLHRKHAGDPHPGIEQLADRPRTPIEQVNCYIGGPHAGLDQQPLIPWEGRKDSTIDLKPLAGGPPVQDVLQIPEPWHERLPLPCRFQSPDCHFSVAMCRGGRTLDFDHVPRLQGRCAGRNLEKGAEVAALHEQHPPRRMAVGHRGQQFHRLSPFRLIQCQLQGGFQVGDDVGGGRQNLQLICNDRCLGRTWRGAGRERILSRCVKASRRHNGSNPSPARNGAPGLGGVATHDAASILRPSGWKMRATWDRRSGKQKIMPLLQEEQSRKTLAPADNMSTQLSAAQTVNFSRFYGGKTVAWQSLGLPDRPPKLLRL